MSKHKKNKNSGITLIALVVTIIVLLILAGISIQMLTGENGIIKRAGEAKEKTTEAEEKEQIQLEVMASYELDGTLLIEVVNTNIKSHINGVVTDDAEEFPLTVTYIATGNEYEIYGNGKVDVKGPSINEIMKVGDYVDYDPTFSDAKKTKKIEDDKLTYISPTGTATEHGNGYISYEEGGGQKFTAKSNEESEIKWRVLTVTDDKIEIIPDTVIKKDNKILDNGDFVLKGARGYLYAEQELNEICKIYGYGYGADTSVGSTFKTDSIMDNKTNTISETGARSITVEDINKIAGIYEDKNDKKMKYKDGTTLNEKYGNTIKLTSTVRYPTSYLGLCDVTTGISVGATLMGYRYTWYTYNKSCIADENIQNMLFNRYYWLASRYMGGGYGSVGFDVRAVNNNWVNGAQYLFEGKSNGYEEYEGRSFGVLPVVTLKSKVIDTSNISSTIGKEDNPWILK